MVNKSIYSMQTESSSGDSSLADKVLDFVVNCTNFEVMLDTGARQSKTQVKLFVIIITAPINAK